MLMIFPGTTISLTIVFPSMADLFRDAEIPSGRDKEQIAFFFQSLKGRDVRFVEFVAFQADQRAVNVKKQVSFSHGVTVSLSVSADSIPQFSLPCQQIIIFRMLYVDFFAHL